MSSGATSRDEQRLGRLEQCFQDAHCHRAKIYGRETERALLEEAYRRVRYPIRELCDDCSCTEFNLRHRTRRDNVDWNVQRPLSELLLIHGATGMGKSGLAHSMDDHVGASGGYVVTVNLKSCGRYDDPHQQFHAVLIDAWTEFVRNVSLHPVRLDHVRRRLARGNLTAKCRVLFNTIPSLKTLFDGEADHSKSTEETTSFSSETTSVETNSVAFQPVSIPVLDWQDTTKGKDFKFCFKEALCTFTRVLATPDNPLVYLWDDLHLADEVTLMQFQSLVQDASIQGLFFIGTCRDDGIYASRWNEIQKVWSEARVSHSTIKLTSLDRSDVVSLIAGVIQTDTERAGSLEALLSIETRQNVFLIWDYLRELHRQELLQWDDVTQQFSWEVDSIRLLGNGVCRMIQARLRTLSPEYQDNLQTAACLGPTLDTRLLIRLMECSDDALDAFLEATKSSDLISFDIGRESWCFAHDMIQESVYDLIPASDQSAHHYRLGRRLWKMFDLDEVNRFIFLIVDQLILGMVHITDGREKCAVAKLCLCAGVRAVRLSRFKSALGYLGQGVALLGTEAWADEYDTCLDLYSATAEIANSLGHFDRVYDLVGGILRNARNFSDTLRGLSAKVHALGSSGKLREAMQLALEVLAKLGEPIPRKVSNVRLSINFAMLRRRIRRKSSESLLRLPNMGNADKIAAMHMLNLTILYALLTNDELIPAIAIRMVCLTLDHGLCAVSCVAFAIFGGALCSYGDLDEGVRISKVSFAIYDRFDTKVWLARLSVIHYYFTFAWVRAFPESRGPLHYSYIIGSEGGDPEFALGCKLVGCFNLAEFLPLPELASDLRDAADEMKAHKQSAFFALTLSKRQMIENLMTIRQNSDSDPWILDGTILNDSGRELIGSMKITDAWHHTHLVLLCLTFNRVVDAAEYAKGCRRLVNRKYGPLAGSLAVFLCGFADVAEARRYKRRAPFAQKCSKLLKRSAEYGEPLNFIGKHYLLEAELAALAGHTAKALTLYVTAISTSCQGKFTQQTALAYERTARFLLEQKDYERAVRYFNEALACYKDWGATAKVEHLENEMRTFCLVD